MPPNPLPPNLLSLAVACLVLAVVLFIAIRGGRAIAAQRALAMHPAPTPIPTAEATRDTAEDAAHAAEEAREFALDQEAREALRAAGADLPRFAPAIAAGYPAEDAVSDYLLQRLGMRIERAAEGVTFLGLFTFNSDKGLALVETESTAPLPEELVRHEAVAAVLAANPFPAPYRLTLHRVVWLAEQRPQRGVSFMGTLIHAQCRLYQDQYLAFAYEPDVELSAETKAEAECNEADIVEREFAAEAPRLSVTAQAEVAAEAAGQSPSSVQT